MPLWQSTLQELKRTSEAIGVLPPWKGGFVLTGVDTGVGNGFAVLPYNVSAKITICVLTEYLILHHGIPHSIASDPGMYFPGREV